MDLLAIALFMDVNRMDHTKYPDNPRLKFFQVEILGGAGIISWILNFNPAKNVSKITIFMDGGNSRTLLDHNTVGLLEYCSIPSPHHRFYPRSTDVDLI